MEHDSLWETMLAGLIAALVIFWSGPGIKAAIARGKQAKADWAAALLPLGLVALVCVFLIFASRPS